MAASGPREAEGGERERRGCERGARMERKGKRRRSTRCRYRGIKNTAAANPRVAGVKKVSKKKEPQIAPVIMPCGATEEAQ